MQANKDGWREGLKYIESLYAEGLIDQAAFTQNARGAAERRATTPKAGHPRSVPVM